MSRKIKIVLAGNPNTGKTSLFNSLTGLNQKVGNYPGITVEKKQGEFKVTPNLKATLIDLPGTYSLHPSTLDEEVAVNILKEKEDPLFPDLVIVVTDVENLKRNLFLYTQIKDLGLPTILAINMVDKAKKKGIEINKEELERKLNTKIVLISSADKTGISELKNVIVNHKELSTEPCYIPSKNIVDERATTEKLKRQRDAIKRHLFINKLLANNYTRKSDKQKKEVRKLLDKVFIHNVWGYFIFFGLMLLIFQALFSWSALPMDLIDEFFASLSEKTRAVLSPGNFTELLANGVIPGVGGVVIFVPQIAFLFLFISFLEESGYMSRAVFLMDKMMRPFGLSGKSVVPLVSGTACAVPAILATRNIEGWKERLITILVTPLTTCSARLPVYIMIISIVIPEKKLLGGYLNTQGLSLGILYLLGFISAIFLAFIFHKTLKEKDKIFFIAEMPDYKIPLLKNMLINVFEKTKVFVFQAGKIILAISIILWALASFGPGDDFNNAKQIVKQENPQLTEAEIQKKVEAQKLENSYIGKMGQFIEPAIKPLGYDWKIGIALITSFAAREVFIGSLATIYSVGTDEELTIKEKMKSEINPDTGKPMYNLATGISLLLFYAFALQCMSTVAVVKRETNGWKWPLIQMFIMTGAAYIISLIAYQVLK